MKNKKFFQGFSLIEILVVVALIIILATITIVAINPAKNFADTRNAQRSSDVGQILNAITQYTSEDGNAIGDFTDAIGGAIAICPLYNAIGTGDVDLKGNLVDEFIVDIPMDPSTGTAVDTGYTICVTAGSRVEITALGAENGKTITVKR